MTHLQDDFFVHLPSNTKHKTKRNKTSSFSVELPNELHLQNDFWEVGLHNISIPLSYYNVPEFPTENRAITIHRQRFILSPELYDVYEERQVRMKSVDCKDLVSECPEVNREYRLYTQYLNANNHIVDHDTFKMRIMIPHGNYPTLADFIDVINEQIEQANSQSIGPKTKRYESTKRYTKFALIKSNRVSLKVSPGDKVFLSNYLTRLFRLENNSSLDEYNRFSFDGGEIYKNRANFNKVNLVSTNQPGFVNKTLGYRELAMLKDILKEKEVFINNYESNSHIIWFQNSEPLYIYSNIVHPEIVGDIVTNLLTRIQPQGKYGDILEKTFSPVQYKKLAFSNIKEIDIEITSEVGKLTQFMYGDIFLTLHFRRKKPQ